MLGKWLQTIVRVGFRYSFWIPGHTYLFPLVQSQLIHQWAKIQYSNFSSKINTHINSQETDKEVISNYENEECPLPKPRQPRNRSFFSLEKQALKDETQIHSTGRNTESIECEETQNQEERNILIRKNQKKAQSTGKINSEEIHEKSQLQDKEKEIYSYKHKYISSIDTKSGKKGIGLEENKENAEEDIFLKASKIPVYANNKGSNIKAKLGAQDGDKNLLKAQISKVQESDNMKVKAEKKMTNKTKPSLFTNDIQIKAYAVNFNPITAREGNSLKKRIDKKEVMGPTVSSDNHKTRKTISIKDNKDIIKNDPRFKFPDECLPCSLKKNGELNKQKYQKTSTYKRGEKESGNADLFDQKYFQKRSFTQISDEKPLCEIKTGNYMNIKCDMSCSTVPDKTRSLEHIKGRHSKMGNKVPNKCNSLPNLKGVEEKSEKSETFNKNIQVIICPKESWDKGRGCVSKFKKNQNKNQTKNQNRNQNKNQKRKTKGYICKKYRDRMKIKDCHSPKLSSYEEACHRLALKRVGTQELKLKRPKTFFGVCQETTPKPLTPRKAKSMNDICPRKKPSYKSSCGSPLIDDCDDRPPQAPQVFFTDRRKIAKVKSSKSWLNVFKVSSKTKCRPSLAPPIKGNMCKKPSLKRINTEPKFSSNVNICPVPTKRSRIRFFRVKKSDTKSTCTNISRKSSCSGTQLKKVIPDKCALSKKVNAEKAVCKQESKLKLSEECTQKKRKNDCCSTHKNTCTNVQRGQGKNVINKTFQGNCKYPSVPLKDEIKQLKELQKIALGKERLPTVYQWLMQKISLDKGKKKRKNIKHPRKKKLCSKPKR